ESFHRFEVSFHATRDAVPAVRPFSPASYLYATQGWFVVARSSCWMRLVPLKIEYWRAPVNTPAVTPANATSIRLPLLRTSQPVTRYVATACLISSRLRGRPGELATPSAGGGFPPVATGESTS